MATDDEEPHASMRSALGAAGEAAAFIAGAPIAGAADAAIGLGDMVAEREAKLEEAITGGHDGAAPDGSRSLWMWLVIAVVVVALGLVLALR